MSDQSDFRPDASGETKFLSCWEVTGCSRSDYVACAAFQQRRNCYEVDRAVCCSKHRDNCPTCPVYVAINRVTVEKIRVNVCTDRFDIVGDLHMPVGARLSDFVNRSDKPFLVLTDARISSVGRPGSVENDSMVVLNKAQVILVWPVDEKDAEDLAA